VENAAVVALNVAVVAEPATLTEAGTVRVAFVFVIVTFAPKAGAACDSVTVQVLDAFGPSEDGLHAREETAAGGTRFTVV
jgi:hypothetical protein